MPSQIQSLQQQLQVLTEDVTAAEEGQRAADAASSELQQEVCRLRDESQRQQAENAALLEVADAKHQDALIDQLLQNDAKVATVRNALSKRCGASKQLELVRHRNYDLTKTQWVRGNATNKVTIDKLANAKETVCLKFCSQ